MTALVVNGAEITCSFGVSPAVLTVVPGPASAGSPASSIATVADSIPVTNIASFGMCSSPNNPAVQSATAAAAGTPTPAPCVPATGTPWTPGSSAVTVNGLPALVEGSTCRCEWFGVISITSVGQVSSTAT
jgi:uncharacterized Zn-binding protein involved in type VI secretion